MEIKILNKIIGTIKSVNSDYCMKELIDVSLLHGDDTIRKGLIDIKLSKDPINTKDTKIKTLICSRQIFKSRAQIPDNLFIYSLFPVPLFLTSCIREFFVYSKLNENTNIPEEIKALTTIEGFGKLKDESLSLDIPSYNSFVDEFWFNCTNPDNIGKVVTFYKNKLKDVIFNFKLRADAIKLMDEDLSKFLEMGLMTDSIFEALRETYKIMVDEKFDYFDKLNYFIEGAEYSMDPENNPNYMGMKQAPSDETRIESSKDNNTYTNIEIKKDIQLTKYDAVKVAEIYKFCIDTNVFRDTISLPNFISGIESANFKEMFNTEGTKKSKLKLVIKALSCSLNNDWYKQTVISIGVTPSQCSGANVSSDEWKKELNAIK